MTFEVIGSPTIQAEYSDEWETVLTVDVQRDDGEVAEEVWLVAGVPDYLRSTARAAGTHRGVERVWVFGDRPDYWCPANITGDYAEIADAIIAACLTAALDLHHSRLVASETQA